MKYLFLTLGIPLSILSFSQEIKDPIEVTPEVEKKIKQEIERSVVRLKGEMKKKQENDLLIEFTIDTFRIEQYMEKYIKYDYSTAGMSSAGYEAAHKYDSLLNKYYRKLLDIFKPDDKKTLIQAQKAWIIYRDSEIKLVETIGKDEYSGGGTIQQLIDSSSYLNLIKDRTIEIFEHLMRATQEY